MRAHNLLEPESWIEAFQNHPPVGFEARSVADRVPAFVAPFDVLTTLDAPLRRRIDALTFHRLPRPRTLFVGTTVSEYMFAPEPNRPESVVDAVLAETQPIRIIKDIPTEAVLVGDAAFEWSQALVAASSRSGFVIVEGQALAYVPIDFESIEEFLGRMSHARRKNVRRKLRSRAKLSIEEGCDLDEMYALYRNVYDQSEIHFDLLTKEFFASVLGGNIVIMYRANGHLIGFNLCVMHAGMLIDKYVGFSYPAAREHDLYTVSWFHNLQMALDRGCRFYVAGWTDPEVKRGLGARFTWTRHAVHLRNPLLRGVLRAFRPLFESDRKWDANRHS